MRGGGLEGATPWPCHTPQSGCRLCWVRASRGFPNLRGRQWGGGWGRHREAPGGHNREGGFITLWTPGRELGRGGAEAWLFQAGALCFSLGAGLWAEPGALEQEGCAHSKSQAGNSRRQNFSVFQFSKIERIKQIRADVPTCNYQLISLDFFFFFLKEISK